MIVDRGRQHYTGTREDDRAGAELALRAFIAEHHSGKPPAINPTIAPFYQRRLPDGPWVYFVSCDQFDFPVKIGWARDIPSRLVTLQNAMPFDLVVLGRIAGDARTESGIHLTFRHLRLRGEWFRRAPELIEYIEKVAATASMDKKQTSVG